MPVAPSAPNVRPWGAASWVLPAVAVVFGFVLRMLFINHESVSGDEAFSMSVSQMPLRQMLPTLVQDYVHPPLHYFALRGWFKLFGYGLFQARLLSAVFGTLAIVFLYLLAEYLFGRRTALLASLLLGISQLGIMFSQEVRPYAQFHFLALCTAYLFLRAFREGRPLFWWSFVTSAILMLYTDYFSLYLIIALMMLPLIYRGASRLRLWWVLSGGALMFASFVPWLTSGILHAAATANKTFMGKETYAAVHWWTLVSIVNSFNNGKPAGLRADSPWWSYIVGGMLFSAPLLLLLATQRQSENDSSARLYKTEHRDGGTTLCRTGAVDADRGQGPADSVQRALRLVLRCVLLHSSGLRPVRTQVAGAALDDGSADCAVQRERLARQLSDALEGTLDGGIRLRPAEPPARRLRRFPAGFRGSSAVANHRGRPAILPYPPPGSCRSGVGRLSSCVGGVMGAAR